MPAANAPKPTLYVFGGLPGTGKTTLARELARRNSAVYLRIDSIEQAMKRAGAPVEGPEGYVAAYALAVDNLRLGLDVIADSVNPLELTRAAWRDVAAQAAANCIEIEVVCSDSTEHRRRVETRVPDIDGHILPKWSDVEDREYDPWESDRIVIDTANRSWAESASELFASLDAKSRPRSA